MQVVIDIPDNEYILVKNLDDFHINRDNIVSYVRNGTPLPKGHGRLADLDAALKCVEDCEDCDDKTFAIALFDWAMSKRVVLEADKEDK